MTREEKAKRVWRSFLIAGAAIIAFALTRWLLYPEPGQLDLATCLPAGSLASLDSMIFGKDFWRVQMPEIQKRLAQAENWDAYQASGRGEEWALMADMHRSLPLSRADALREMAEWLDEVADHQRMHDYMQERMIPLLRNCEAQLKDKIK